VKPRDALLLALACAPACGGNATEAGGNAGSGDPKTGGVSIEKYLHANCDWQKSCGHGTGACTPQAAYQTDPVFLPRVIDEMANCQATLACTANDDVCGDDILGREATAATGARKDALEACSTALSGCSLGTLECLPLGIMTDGALPPFTACFAQKDCTTLQSCLSALGFPTVPSSA
jgi:hypothetical protein